MASSTAPFASTSTEKSCLCSTVNAPSATPSQHAPSTAKCKMCRTKPRFAFLRGQRSLDLGQQGPSSAGKFDRVCLPSFKRKTNFKLSLYARNGVKWGEGGKCPLITNPSKTKRVCFIQELSPYRAVNTLDHGYAKPIC